MGSTAFLAPEICTSPLSGTPPEITIFAMGYSFLFLLRRFVGRNKVAVAVVGASLLALAQHDMAQGRHTGKLVITHDDPSLLLEERTDRLAELTAGTCLITGGLGGLGLAVAQWLVERGARRIALLGRSAVGAEQQAAIGRLRARGASVRPESPPSPRHRRSAG